MENWQVEDPNVPGRMVCKGSSFHVRAGEIVGFAALLFLFDLDPVTCR